MKADDLDGVTDPSKLSESDFAPGTKWTNAGWTRSKYSNDDIALKSNIKLSTRDNPNLATATAPIDISSSFDYKFSAIFTLSKNQVSHKGTILVGSLQKYNNLHGNNISDNMQLPYQFSDVDFGKFAVNIDGTEHIIGHIHLHQVDNAEYDLLLEITNPLSDISSSTIDCSYSTQQAFSMNFAQNFKIFQGISDKKPFINYMITPSSIDKRTWLDKNIYEQSYYNNPGYDLSAFNSPFGTVYAQYGGGTLSDFPIKVFKEQSSKNVDLTQKGLYNWLSFRVLDSKNKLTNDIVPIVSSSFWKPTIKKLADNLTSLDIYSYMKLHPDTIAYSMQQDGSDIVGMYPKNMKIPVSEIKEAIEHSSILYNVHDVVNQDKIMQNNLNYYTKENPNVEVASCEATSDNLYNNRDSDMFLRTTDLTPNSNNSTSITYLSKNGSSANAELYRTALVHYLDSKTGNNISTDSIMGTKNNATNYTLNIPKDYILDTKSGKNKDGTQYKWSADKKSIAYTFNEDQKVNDANPINIYITHGTHNTNDNSGKSTRTIQYTGLPDNLKPKDNVQTVLFKRSGVTDDVTGETTYGDWQPQAGNGHYTAVPSPTFAGYQPDQEVIPDEAATPNKNENITVNYSRTNQHAKLAVHDDTANTDLNDYAENSTGLYQDQINFKTAPSAVEQELKDKGYNIVSDSFKGSPTYNADDSKNSFVIHVTHKIVPVTPDQPKTPTDVIPDTKQHYPTGVDTNDLNKDVQRSIFYKYEDNSQAEPTVVQKAHFSRTVKVDAVTQKIVDDGTWSTKDNYPEVATKSIDGYTPDKTKVGSATPSMTTNQDQTVVYHANDEDAAITYIDDTTGKVLKTDTQKAKYKQTIKFAIDPNTQIQTYKDQGYVLVSSDWKDGSTYQTDPTKNKFTVHLKHGTSTVTPDKPKKPTDIIPGTKQHYPTGVDTNDLNQPQQRQITYTYADSKKQASPTVTQKSTFHRTATVDNVTGKTTYTDWTTSDQYPEVKSPTIEGYTPDKSNVPATKPELNQKQDVAVVYNPNPEQVDVIAKDNAGKQLSKSTLHGNYNTDYTATTPVIKGYHLIKMPTNTHGTYKTHNDPIIYIYAPDSNSVPEQTDGTPKPDKSSYPNDLTPAKRSNKLPETGSINLTTELKSVTNNITHTLSHLLH